MFWDRFEGLCKENKCRPNNVMQALGLSAATATKWKNGSIPNGDALQKVADYFNVSTDYLLGRTPYKRPTDDPSLVWGYVTPTGRELTPEEQEEAKKYIDMMVRAHDAENRDK